MLLPSREKRFLKAGYYYFAFDTSELTRGDFASRMNAYAVALQNNIYQLDEIREMEDKPPLGFNFIKLGLDAVLVDPKTREIYTPNTGKLEKMNAEHLTNEQLRAILEERARHWIKGEHGYFMGSVSDGQSGGGAGGGASGGSTDNHTLSEDAEFDAISENSSKPITQITDSAIEKVPMVSITGYSEEQCVEIQRQHQELLKYAREHNGCNEVAFVFNSDITSRKEFTGTDDSLEFGSYLYGKDLFVMHNHPRNSSFSYDDVVEFVRNESIKTLSVVKNNGKVEVLTKRVGYDRLSYLIELNRAEKNTVKTNSDAEYRKLVDNFLIKHVEGGVFEWIK